MCQTPIPRKAAKDKGFSDPQGRVEAESKRLQQEARKNKSKNGEVKGHEKSK